MTEYCGRCGGIFTSKMTVERGEEGKAYHAYCAWANWKDSQKKLEEDYNKRKELEKSSNLPKG